MGITELMQQNPRVSIILIGVVLTFFSTIVTKWLTNQEHLKQLKARQKEAQKEMKECRKSGDTCKMEELNSEVLKITMTMMKSSFRPMFVTMIPFLIVIYWIREVYAPVEGFSWFWWYLGGALISSIVFRRVLKVA